MVDFEALDRRAVRADPETAVAARFYHVSRSGLGTSGVGSPFKSRGIGEHARRQVVSRRGLAGSRVQMETGGGVSRRSDGDSVPTSFAASGASSARAREPATETRRRLGRQGRWIPPEADESTRGLRSALTASNVASSGTS